MLPALAHVRAARALADRVQVERAHDALQLLVIGAAKEAHAQPRWPGMRSGAGGGAAASGQDVERRGHSDKLTGQLRLFYAVLNR